MRRGEVWWARLGGPAGERPVVIVTRGSAVPVRALVTVVQVTTRRRGLETEVSLGPADGLPKPCVANADVLLTVAKSCLVRRLAVLSDGKLRALSRAVRFALGLD
ncbi:MAG: type II toxin-antitoxin system PemK/MazF family toxin [Elusimicrobia bacterium]|nr:type II toxin-antitoxin system PemK/MazF family toxin [Elusimicrobiota bacterium]